MVPFVSILLHPSEIQMTRMLYSYADAHELYTYFKGCAKKWNCMQYVKLEHQVVGATWDEERFKWIVQVEDLAAGKVFTDECDVLLSATGILKYVSPQDHY